MMETERLKYQSNTFAVKCFLNAAEYCRMWDMEMI